MKRFIALPLSICIVFILCACDAEQMERKEKAERSAEAQRIINNAAEESRTGDTYSERSTADKNAERRRAQAND